MTADEIRYIGTQHDLYWLCEIAAQLAEQTETSKQLLEIMKRRESHELALEILHKEE